MGSRTPDEAIASFVERLRPVAGCITQIPLTALPTRTGAYAVIFRGGAPVELRTDRDRPPVLLSVVIQCRPQPDPSDQRRFTVNSTYDAFEILDLDQHELLVYHWHPEVISQVVEPHLHLSPRMPPVPVATRGNRPEHVMLSDMHIPTGHVYLADIVHLLITEFMASPLRKDWDNVLAESKRSARTE